MTYREIYDAYGGIVRRVVYNPLTAEAEGMVWQAEQECDAIVAANKRDRDIGTATRGDGPMGMRLAARIPVEVINRAMREGWYNDRAKWRAWMNDPDNRAFRVWEGRV